MSSLWLKWFHFKIFEDLFAIKSISRKKTSRETSKMISVDSEAVFAWRITSPCSQTLCKGKKLIFICLEASTILSGPTAKRKVIQKSLKTRLGRYLTPKMEFHVTRRNSASPVNLLCCKWSCFSNKNSLWGLLRIRVSPVHELAEWKRINPTRVSNLLSMALCLTVASFSQWFCSSPVIHFGSQAMWFANAKTASVKLCFFLFCFFRLFQVRAQTSPVLWHVKSMLSVTGIIL